MSYEEVFSQSSSTNCTVYCGNLAQGSTEEALQKIFGPYGQIQEIRVFKDKGYAFIRWGTELSRSHDPLSIFYLLSPPFSTVSPSLYILRTLSISIYRSIWLALAMSSSVPHLLVSSLHPFPPPPPSNPTTPLRAHSTIYYLLLIRFLIHCLVFLCPCLFSFLPFALFRIRFPSCPGLIYFQFQLYSFFLKVCLKRVGHAGHCLCSQHWSEWTECQVLVGQGAGRARQCQQCPGMPLCLCASSLSLDSKHHQQKYICRSIVFLQHAITV